MQYLAKNIVIPDADKKTTPVGLVVIRFIVGQDGRVGSAEIIKDGGVGKATQEHLLEIVTNMPRWTPAQKEGKAVSTYFTLPVRIAID